MTRRADDKGFSCFVRALLGYMEIRSRIPERADYIGGNVSNVATLGSHLDEDTPSVITKFSC
jgi:hypothetical protein